MRVQFLKDTSTAIIPESFKQGNTLVVFRDGYKLPNIENAVYIDFEKYKSTYINHKPTNIVLVGTNRIFVPANRCDMVYEYLQTMTGHIDKISIDNLPFIGEPWRLWFHYSIAFGQWLGYNYSYIVETDWKHWFYRDSESSVISAKGIKGKLLETFIDIEPLKSEFNFYEPNKIIQEYYQEIKSHAFEKYTSPKQIIQFMLRHLNKAVQIEFDYDSFTKNKSFNLPDFGVYNFVAEENKRRMEIFNTIINEGKKI